MFRKRLITVFLLKDQALVKSIQFKKFIYIGDPLNAVRIFNEFSADELLFLDIDASKENRTIDPLLVQKINFEATMPFGVGGGIKSLNDIEKIIQAGAEKIVLGNIALANPNFVKEAASHFGSSTICVCIDYKKHWFYGIQTYGLSGRKKYTKDPLTFAKEMEEMGAGEIILQSIERDGTFSGYDYELLHQISEEISVPITALGGAKNHQEMQFILDESKVNAAASGSCFVFNDSSRGVLLNYPKRLK